MGFKCGIVGLPNVGKSTLFNALTETSSAEAANYPFCTIEPNSGIVSVPDKRLNLLSNLAKSQKTIPAQMQFVDIAGLVSGASKGEGLGNKFLAHIREVDAIVHVVRCFENTDITHVDNSINPLRDTETIDTELMLADLESLERQTQNLSKKAKSNDIDAKNDLVLMRKLTEFLTDGIQLRLANLTDEEISEHDALMTEAAAHEKSVNDINAAKKANQNSGKSKLKALGLSDDEIAALLENNINN